MIQARVDFPEPLPPTISTPSRRADDQIDPVQGRLGPGRAGTVGVLDAAQLQLPATVRDNPVSVSDRTGR